MNHKLSLVFLISLILIQPIFAFDNESFSAWSKAIRDFSGLNNIRAKVSIETKLLDKDGSFFSDEILLEFWSRSLRDYRIDMIKPEFLSGITMLYQYKEDLLYVLNTQTKEYALQRFDLNEDTKFNPADALVSVLDFLINLKSTPLLEIVPKKSPDGAYSFYIEVGAGDFLSFFRKEYPTIIVELNSEQELCSLTLYNSKTNEFLKISILETEINPSEKSIDKYFSFKLGDYQLVEYLGRPLN